MDQEQ